MATVRQPLLLIDERMRVVIANASFRETFALPPVDLRERMLTTGSDADTDIADSYDLGAASYITKPETFDGLVTTMRSLRQYWFEVVELPR